VTNGPYLSNTEAADYLGVSPNTLNWWRSRDRGPRYSKMGKLVKYRQVDLDAFAQATVVEPSRTPIDAFFDRLKDSSVREAGLPDER